ncbi:flagellar hook-length control protein FliK [Methylobacterium sp. J-078]|uniref:flagellar hook-length control protein FliK n=1 Tax=Methylobacterium sp. J-078 TaxID=2836657 RepID=UPI001FBB967C|nr:flagellar hook-length control protein FliK [Methylobacterium sp. J-078]MCJ2044256.1 flagellar hook-length control protein FliK [Methylobacterium sp. J-078]
MAFPAIDMDSSTLRLASAMPARSREPGAHAFTIDLSAPEAAPPPVLVRQVSAATVPTTPAIDPDASAAATDFLALLEGPSAAAGQASPLGQAAAQATPATRSLSARTVATPVAPDAGSPPDGGSARSAGLLPPAPLGAVLPPEPASGTMPVAEAAKPDASGAAPDPSTEPDSKTVGDLPAETQAAPANSTPPPVAIAQPAPPPPFPPAPAVTPPPEGTVPATPGARTSAARGPVAASATQAADTGPNAASAATPNVETGEPSSAQPVASRSAPAEAGLAAALASLQPAGPGANLPGTPIQPPSANQPGEIPAQTAGAQLVGAAASAARGASRPGRGEAATSGETTASTKEGEPASFLAADADPSALLAQAPTAAAPHAPTLEAAIPARHEAPAPAPIPLGVVPMTIGLRSLSGSNTFEIRLDPKDLGRIEVNLAIDKETGAVQASLVVDRPETLALLQRDAGNLQQALTQAGLDAPDGSITVSLRGDGAGSDAGADGQGSGGQGANGQGSNGQGSGPQGQPRRPGHETQSPLNAVPLRLYGAGRGLDIRI